MSNHLHHRIASGRPLYRSYLHVPAVHIFAVTSPANRRASVTRESCFSTALAPTLALGCPLPWSSRPDGSCNCCARPMASTLCALGRSCSRVLASADAHRRARRRLAPSHSQITEAPCCLADALRSVRALAVSTTCSAQARWRPFIHACRHCHIARSLAGTAAFYRSPAHMPSM